MKEFGFAASPFSALSLLLLLQMAWPVPTAPRPNNDTAGGTGG